MGQQKLFVGIDLGGTNIKGGVVKTAGEVIIEKKIPTEAQGGVDHVLDRICTCVQELIKNVGERAKVSGVGIGVPGLVNVKEGVVREPPNLPGWSEVWVGPEMKKRLGLSVTVDNDANVAALGEFAYGAGRGVTEMLMITLGTGVGGGLVLRGEIYRGGKGAAGEFGHIIIQQDGPLCGCGNKGCVEAFVGLQGILRCAREKLESGRKSLLSQIDPSRMTPKDISEAAIEGDDVALEVLREVGGHLGVGLGSVANLLNIERVVVGGGVANAGDLILDPARESLNRVAFAVSRETIEVVPAVLGEQAGLVGAARLAMKEGIF